MEKILFLIFQIIMVLYGLAMISLIFWVVLKIVLPPLIAESKEKKKLTFGYILKQGEINTQIKKKMNQIEEQKQFHFKTIVPFRFDFVYLFEPKTDIGSIHEEISFAWREICETGIDRNPYSQLIVFTKNQKVVHYLLYYRRGYRIIKEPDDGFHWVRS